MPRPMAQRPDDRRGARTDEPRADRRREHDLLDHLPGPASIFGPEVGFEVYECPRCGATDVRQRESEPVPRCAKHGAMRRQEA